MKNIFLVISFVLGIQTTNIYAQDNNSNTEKNRIILVNPGVFYLKSLNYITNKSIIDIDNLEYQAVFYSKSEVSYDDAKKYIDENNISNIKLQKIEGELTANNLFQKNSCTASFKQLFENSEGIIFLGGWDIPAEIYNSKTNLHTQIRTPNRHYFELSFLYHLLGNGKNTPLLETKPDYVVYGICLGMQSMSVATGGDMYQDIPSEVYGAKYAEDVLALDKNKQHRSYWKNIDRDETLDGHSFHQIKPTKNSFFQKHLNLKSSDTPYVCSSHHQAIKNIGYGWEVIATSMDGKIIEAIHHKKYKNVLGVQFHPEFYYLHDADSKKFKFESNDKELRTEYEMINELRGYQFNLDYWKYFSSLFKSVK
jgi:putative glutamine amidotransferase